MPLRLRWYEFPRSPELLLRLGRQMLAEQYRVGQRSGFRMEVVRRDELEGRYIERRDYVEEVEDPLGERIQIPRVEFRQVAFKANGMSPLLELTDAGRDAPLLFERLAAMAGDSIYVRPLTVDVSLWLRHLEAQHGTVKVLAARLSDLALSTTASASVTVKGTQDVRRHLDELLHGRHGTIERVHLELKRRTGTLNLELAQDGRAVIHHGGEVAGTLAAESLAATRNAGDSDPKAPLH